ncbi:MAG TPA: metallophosphoesterase family protein [Candidatus Cloacimonadota bacterium]|nr:metallophosphoesterase family protein [Candidatus Cloacimonadota bacterium]HOQ79929.1 metallophosphoesterase family protein [Candidatus Cloacimonadota bacterium]
MKRILVVSDTHGNYQFLNEVLSFEKKIDILIHLGDEHTDIDNFVELLDKMRVFSVAGIHHRDYLNQSKRKLNFNLESLRFQITHSPKDLDLTSKNIDIFIHGHTHLSLIDEHKTFVILNPGHLKSEIDRGEHPTYMVLEVKDHDLMVSLKNRHGGIIEYKEVNFANEI